MNPVLIILIGICAIILWIILIPMLVKIVRILSKKWSKIFNTTKEDE